MVNVIGKRLRMAREAKNFTQVQVMQYTNVNNKTLSGYEKGVSEPDIDTLKILAKLYETGVEYLIGNTDDPTPPLHLKNDNDLFPPEARKDYGVEYIKLKETVDKLNITPEEAIKVLEEIYANEETREIINLLRKIKKKGE